MGEIAVSSQQHGQNPSSMEQVFSNHVLLNTIWKHLGSQDLIRASLVNNAWFVKSRETLIQGSQKNKYPVCIQLDNISPCPCRALVEFNRFLEEEYGSNSISIVFNGIQVVERYAYDNTDQKCIGVSREDPLYEVLHSGKDNRLRNERNSDKQIRNIPKIYGKTLDTIKLKYLRLENYSYDHFCPFSKFLNFVTSRDAENILEWTIKEDGDANRLVPDFFRGPVSPGAAGCSKFPNLQILGIPKIKLPYSWSGLQTILPSLKRIHRLQLNPTSPYWQFVRDFPFHAIRNLGKLKCDKETAGVTLEFIQKYEPKIENLYFEQNPQDRENEEGNTEGLQQDLFQIGRLVSNSLKTLTCSPSTLSFLVGQFDIFDRTWQKNQFSALKSLNLMVPTSVDSMDWFGLEEFEQVFPTLRQMRINCVNLNPEHRVSAVSGPYNLVHGSFCVKSVRCLVLEASQFNTVTMGFVSCLHNLFANITHLNLVEMPLKYDCDDRAFAGILAQSNNMALLEELSIKSADLESFCLNHLFQENILKVSKILKANDLEQLLVYKTSLLDNKRLTKINIHGKEICITCRKKDGEKQCYSRQLPGAFLVSSKTAQSICRQLPGFKFSLVIRGKGECYCSGVFRPGGFRFEHLEPHANISSREIHKFERHWEIEFSNKSVEDDLELQHNFHF